MEKYWLPTKPYTIEQLIHRRAAAQGKPITAMRAHMAGYNGHYNTVSWNDYRSYYVGQYTWGGRNVFFRGTDINNAISAAKREYNNQGAGAVMYIYPHTPEDEKAIINDGSFQLWTKEVEDEHKATYTTWKHQYVCDLVDYMGGLNVQRMQLLLNVGNEQEYLDNRFNVGMAWQDKRNKELSEIFDKALDNL